MKIGGTVKKSLLVVAVAALTALGMSAAVAASSGESDQTVSGTVPFAGYSADDARRANILSPTFEQLSVLPGFVDGGFREGTDELEFYWDGELSERALRYVEDARNRGVVVHVTPILLSHDEAVEVAERVNAELVDLGAELIGFSVDPGTRTLHVLVAKTPEGRSAVETITSNKRLRSSFGADVAFELTEVGGVLFASGRADGG